MRKKNQAHVIFIIDSSGSMKAQDVSTSGGKISRYEAVVKCCQSFIDEQKKLEGEEINDRYSILTFSTKATVFLKDGTIDDAVNTIGNLYSKCDGGGTNYCAGVNEANSILSTSTTTMKKCIIFLSDGQPGDNVHPALDKLIKENGSGLQLNTVGFGLDSFTVLQEMADKKRSDKVIGKFYSSGLDLTTLTRKFIEISTSVSIFK